MEALLSLSNDLAGAVERVAPAIVAVHARRHLPSSGIHWRPGIVVTADHTVRAEEDITVSTADGRARPAVLAGRDPGTDLAVLRVAELSTSTVALGDDGALRVGHMALALGYGPRASWGVISALGPRWRSWRGGEIDRLVRLDLVLYPGFSGGPLVDASGHVVGLNTSGLAREARLAVPVTTVSRVVDELLRKGHVSRGYLGLGMQPVRLPEPLRAQLHLERDTGLMVVTVQPDGPAGRAGVLLGDVLVALDGAPVADLDDVQARLGGDRIGAV
ncbi:MAG TPA: S1C family serine protease, partial [Methylomirabilota bacterium]|nr:S1C family serine protease [Methylomirabilota bacterium]